MRSISSLRPVIRMIPTSERTRSSRVRVRPSLPGRMSSSTSSTGWPRWAHSAGRLPPARRCRRRGRHSPPRRDRPGEAHESPGRRRPPIRAEPSPSPLPPAGRGVSCSGLSDGGRKGPRLPLPAAAYPLLNERSTSFHRTPEAAMGARLQTIHPGLANLHALPRREGRGIQPRLQPQPVEQGA